MYEIGGCQRQGVGGRRMDEKGQKVNKKQIKRRKRDNISWSGSKSSSAP